ncbi:ArnT family glycosyltransferase [Hymenobacter artigasi]|uniref:Glycosyltransferase RgtA/B/C/D-like domain-containing protein n=1 Tax=Hymenobacter artigasi TaxID=2719616 RepID=A0ABX1HMJ1_9BACT|nr:glycosyltransferase family 39 protein [Hymenobacter artigasi]NKI91471.1 hypothetical protein [Hymenobacter artigasi]
MNTNVSPATASHSTSRLFPYAVPLLLTLGMVVRLWFVWVGAMLYYKSSSPFINDDTASYTDSFINLWHRGLYSFNLLNPEAAFGRLPGYPFFWGAHYLLFGKQYVFQAVAFSQCLLDTLAIYLVYAAAKALSHDVRAAWISGLFYALYPFILVWMPVSSTEAFATFLTIAVFWWLATRPVDKRNALVAGLLVGLSLIVREYLGILLVPVFFWLYTAKGFGRQFVGLSFVALLGFTALYIGWPVRNYVFQHRFLLLKPPTAGYERYTEDVNSARKWIYGWDPDANAYLDGIAGITVLPEFPADVFGTYAETARAQALIQMARQCGTGFYIWRTNQHYSQASNCNAELRAGFTALDSSYQQRHPFRYWTRVPLLNLKKAFFKNQLMQGGSKLIGMLFLYRSIMLIVCLVGAFLLRRHRSVWPLLFFFAFMYLFICVGLRQLEMRYLIQSDAALLILAGVPFGWLLNRLEHLAPTQSKR